MARVAATAVPGLLCYATTGSVLGSCKLNQSLHYLPTRIISSLCRRVSSNVPRACSSMSMPTGYELAVKENAITEEAEEVESEEEVSVESEEEVSEDGPDDDETEDVDSGANTERESGEMKTGELKTSEKEEGPWKSRFPSLNSKERKELRAYAHKLGKDIIVQHIGKWGVTPTVAKSLSDTLEANELIKLKVLDNCSNELEQIILQLENTLEAQVVGKTGRMLVLYRPSLRKLEVEKKKREEARKKDRRRPPTKSSKFARQKRR